MSYLAIQTIELQYTDDQRGREFAEKRERIRGLPLVLRVGEGVLHACVLNDWDDFRPMASASAASAAKAVFIDGTYEVRVDGAGLRVVAVGGAEPWTSKVVLRAATGTWGRLIWNTKRSTHDEKWLVEIVLNAGLFEAPPAEGVFLGEPSAERDLRRDFVRAGYRRG